MQAQQDGRIKAGQAHGNRIAMRFFLFFRKGTSAAHMPPSRACPPRMALSAVTAFSCTVSVRCRILRASRACPPRMALSDVAAFFMHRVRAMRDSPRKPRLCDAGTHFPTLQENGFFCALRQIRFFDAQTHSTFPCCMLCANQTNPCHISPCC